MARFIIIITLAAITFNTGNLHIIGLSFTSNAIVMQHKENQHIIQSYIPDAITGLQSLFLHLLQNDNVAENASQDTGDCVVRCKKTARVVRSS